MIDQKVTSGFPTLESLALNRLRDRFPPFQRRGLATTLRAAFPDIQPAEVRIIPDGWFIEGDLRAGEKGGPWAKVTCLEIEDRNPLTPEKLWRYCDLYDTLDAFCCDLRLLVFDRYGFNERELDLGTLYLEGLVESAATARARAPSAPKEQFSKLSSRSKRQRGL